MMKKTDLIVILLWTLLTQTPAAAGVGYGKSSLSAAPHAALLGRMERSLGIPKGLLVAISKAESGRMNHDQTTVSPWPWSLNVGGEGRFFKSKEEAVAAADALIKKGVRNFDVGLMQVNLHHHPDAFTSVEAAFDPKHNIHYAGKFLLDLKKRLGSWEKAIAHYHSSDPTYHVPYRKKVMNLWKKEQKNGPFPLRWEDAAFDRSHTVFRGRMGPTPDWGKKTAGYDGDYLRVFRAKVKNRMILKGQGNNGHNHNRHLPVPSWRQISAITMGKHAPGVRVLYPRTRR